MIFSLQISWVIDFVPPWLAVSLVLGGIGLVVLSRFLFEDTDTPTEHIGLIIAVIGVFVYFYGGYKKFPDVTMGIILFFAAYVEGLSAVRFWQKVTSLVKTRDVGVVRTGTLSRRIVSILLTIMMVILIFWVLVALIIWGPIELQAEYTVRLFWTLVTVVASILGLSAKYWSMTEDLGSLELLGVITIIVGAEIYNMATFSSEVSIYVITMVLYNLGYGVAIYKLYDEM